MGFISKLLSSVSSAVLLLLGASGASANTPPQVVELEKQLPGVLGGALQSSDLLAGFILHTGGRYTEDTAEAAIQHMFDGLPADRVAELPNFVRGLRSLGLSPKVEVAAVETLITMLEQRSGSLVSEQQAAAVTLQIFGMFVEPIRVAQGLGEDPTGKFFEGNPSGQVPPGKEKKDPEDRGRPFQMAQEFEWLILDQPENVEHEIDDDDITRS